MIGVPEAFARATIEREGEAGAAWVAALPAIVEELFGRWECVPDGEVMYGGVGVIVPVRRAGGCAVLKVSFPHPGNVYEPDAFVAWGGRGAVRLFERNDERFAMLLERAGTSTLADVGGDAIAEVAGWVNRRLAIPAPVGFPRLSAQAAAWEEQLRGDAVELGALPKEAVDAAVATVRELGAEQPELVVHGDLNARNILSAVREPWLVVDPKGYVGDPAYDVGAVLKSRALSLLEGGDPREVVDRTVDIFAEAADLDRERVRRWAQLHTVQAAFWGRRHGFRRARGGPHLDRLIELVDELALSFATPKNT